MEPGRNPVDDLAVIENELSRYGGLEDRPRLVALEQDRRPGRAATCPTSSSTTSASRG
jgi:hypothetical protein